MDAEYADLAAPTRGLPAGLVLVEAAAAAFARWLESRGLIEWQIFQSNVDLTDLIAHAPDPGPAEWFTLEALTGDGGAAVHRLIESRETFTLYPSGACVLEPHAIAVARWYYVDTYEGAYRTLALVAAPDGATVERVNAVVRAKMHDARHATWQILRGSYVEKESAPRPPVAADALIVPPALAERVDRDIVGFFRPEVAAMYRAMNVPHRRGVLMYGPPGNGKTSLIRAIGGALPNVAALILRANAAFDSDDLEFAIDLWTKQAPAMLVIEDLNWLMAQVNVSTFLNLLDGIDTPATAGGLLLVASTNHPEKLDAALSNRPGRFDVVMELPPPDEETRARYFARHLPAFDGATLARFAEASEGLSFAHLGEVARLAGLLALHAGRAERSADDVDRAIDSTQASRREADDGFRGPPPAFGLHKLVKKA